MKKGGRISALWYLYSDPAVAHASSPHRATPVSSMGWATKRSSVWAGADLPVGTQWNCRLGSRGTRLTDCRPFHRVPVLAFDSLQCTGVGRWGSAGPGARGRLDDVHLSLTVKASDYCVCPESQGVLGRCCKMCTQMSVPGIASAIGLIMPGTCINYRHLSKATSLHPEKISRWKKPASLRKFGLKWPLGQIRLPSLCFWKKLMNQVAPNDKYLQLCFVMKLSFSMARLREAWWNAQHERPLFHFHQQTCLSSRTTDFCGTSQMLRVARA